MKSPDRAMSGRAARKRSSKREIAVGGVAAVHRPQHAVGSALHRQVEERHQLVDLAVRGDQAVGHVGRMAGGVADALQIRAARRARGSTRRGRSARPAASSPRPRVDVLAQQGDLARAGFDQPLRFVDQILERAGYFGAAGVGDHAISAELVAPFLHRQERARADPPARGQARRTWRRRACRYRSPARRAPPRRSSRASGDRPAGRPPCSPPARAP